MTLARRIARRVRAPRHDKTASYDDIVQEAALIIWVLLPKYDPACGIPWEKWMWVRALGDTRDRFKPAWRRIHAGKPGVFCFTDWVNSVTSNQGAIEFDSLLNFLLSRESASGLDVETKFDLIDSIERLPEKQRDVIIARFYEGKTQADIAADLGVSQPAVCKLLLRALTTLRGEHVE